MLLPPNLLLSEPTNPLQKLHLSKMDEFFGSDFPEKPYKDILCMNLAYGVLKTHDLNEFCDTMHTALYWLNDKYKHLFKLDGTIEVMRTYNQVERGVESINDYKMDAVFGEWAFSVAHDEQRIRDTFMEALKSTEEAFIENLMIYKDEHEILETFCYTWIKKIHDHSVIAAFSNYMLYMMTKASLKLNGKSDPLKELMTKVHSLIISSTKFCIMASHNMTMN